MKFYKMVFFNSMILGTLVAVSSYSWMSMWMGLEINLLSIIPLFSSQKNMFSSESSMKYFITQAIASSVLLMSVIMLLLTNEFIAPTMNFYFTMTLNSALLTKLGAAPFHYWFPEVMEGLNWMNCFILLTWQKIAPMTLLMNTYMNPNFLITIIVTCLITSTLMAFNQISLRKILTFSSINHIGWMLSSMFMSYSMWTVYFLVYSFLNLNIILMFNLTNSFYLNQINNMMNSNKKIKLAFMTNFLSLGGLPPFVGFLPKWLLINWLITNKFLMVALMTIMMTLIMLYVYTRITFSSLMMSLNEPKMTNFPMQNKTILMLNSMALTSLILYPLAFNFI
uniref:NADH-ubiquinone oxidoreductase chain 2 n=1 Tax=Machla setosa TaxID=2720694 RepID=A0A8F3FHR7_9CUCU|nr:NADH dehydrogenase subunit 2 [Machla setosa]